MNRRRGGCAALFFLRSSRCLVRFLSSPTTAAAPRHPPEPRQLPTFLREDDSPGAHSSPRRPLVSIVTLCAEGRFQEAIGALYHQRGRVCDAVQVLDFIKDGRPVPPAVYDSLFLLSLRHCAVDEARRVYGHATSSGFLPGIVVSNRLIALFAKSGCILDARQMFDHMPQRDACSWNTVISGYAKGGDMAEAHRLFAEMPGEMKDGFSWSTVMSGYVRHGQPAEALRLYREMHMEGKSARNNKFTVSSALAASAAVLSLRFGKEIHGYIIRGELASDAVVWSALSDMYAKCGAMVEARRIFDGTSDKDVVSWSGMIGRYFDAGQNEEGLSLFSDMLRSGVRPNEFTFAGVLNACSERTMEGVGKQVHGHMMRIGWDPFSFAAGALIDMYSKCGNVESARKVFGGIPQPDLVSWTSIISGLAQNGYPEEALMYFESLMKSGTKPDHITFVGVLSACTHSGLVDKGLEIFHSIEKEHGLVHSNDHYACVVDLLSRAGRFKEAEDIISKMPMKPDKFLWASLLGGCRIHKNLRLAKLAADALFEIEPYNAATYVTLANIYAAAGLWEDVSKIRKMMDDRRVVKKPGSSWIEVERKVHWFLVGDESHPRIKEIHSQLNKWSAKMKEEGYIPDTNFVLHDVEEEQKEQNLVHHSEKLAVAFGIISTPPQTPIKVFKNLRICGDCHTAIKFISRIVQREIIVRDSSRFHHFKHGGCRCRDYW